MFFHQIHRPVTENVDRLEDNLGEKLFQMKFYLGAKKTEEVGQDLKDKVSF